MEKQEIQKVNKKNKLANVRLIWPLIIGLTVGVAIVLILWAIFSNV
ncbi:hypothetical protein ACXYRQ_02600 [Mycoplasma sp. 394]